MTRDPAATTQTIHDLAFVNFHAIRMWFVPTAWATAPDTVYEWESIAFPPKPLRKIPKEPGVYAFVVSTLAFGFPAASGLLYIGKATNLYDRVRAYTNEIDLEFEKSDRPLVWRMINQWKTHLTYYYTTMPDVASAEALESQMYNALIPPINRHFSGTLGKQMRAFE